MEFEHWRLRRALLSFPGAAAAGPISSERGDGAEGSDQGVGRDFGRSQDRSAPFETLDPNVVIILVVLLFALICAAFLNSIMRCVLRRSNGPTQRTYEAQTVRGLDDKALASLPVLSYRTAQMKKLREENSPGECSICLTDFLENENVRLLPKCNHVFHVGCIDMWLLSHVSCPVCRDHLVDDAKVVVVREQSDFTSTSHTRTELLLREMASSSSGSSSSNGGESSNEGSRGRRERGFRASLSAMLESQRVTNLFGGSASRGQERAVASSSGQTGMASHGTNRPMETNVQLQRQ